MRYWFDTLREALDAEAISEYWPLTQSVRYEETVRLHVDDGSRYGRVISVYRSSTGRYERPVTYQC